MPDDFAPERAVVIPELISSTGIKRDQAVASILRSTGEVIAAVICSTGKPFSLCKCLLTLPVASIT